MGRIQAALRAGPSPPAVALGLVLTLLAVAAAWYALSPRERDDPHGALVITTGQQSGVYYSWARTLARETHDAFPSLDVEVLESSGSVENIRRVANGVADLGITTEDAAEAPAAGTGPPAAPGATSTPKPVDRSKLVALARIYDDYVHVVVRADSPVRSLAQLQGLRVNVGQPGSGVELVARRVLTEARLTVQQEALDLRLATRALAERRVDAVFWSGGLPTGAVTDLARRVRLRLLPLDPPLLTKLREEYGVAYRPAQIPAGSYGLSTPVATIASPNLLIARRDADGAMVRALLDTLFRRRDVIAGAVPAANGLDRRTAISSGSMPLHPAAVAYFRGVKP